MSHLISFALGSASCFLAFCLGGAGHSANPTKSFDELTVKTLHAERITSTRIDTALLNIRDADGNFGGSWFILGKSARLNVASPATGNGIYLTCFEDKPAALHVVAGRLSDPEEGTILSTRQLVITDKESGTTGSVFLSEDQVVVTSESGRWFNASSLIRASDGQWFDDPEEQDEN